VETELWINLIEEAQSHNIEIIIVNGRISDSSFKTYKKLRFLFNNSLNKISKCLVRYREDGNRFAQLGIDTAKIKVTGNLKLAMNPKPEHLEIKKEKPLILFASTREGEEKLILDTIVKLIKKNEISTIFAPRHPERTDEITKLCKQHGLLTAFSKKNYSFNLKHNEVLIVNETGRLLSFYSKADLVFVGGSLVPLGGQNFVEPFFFEKPVITGKHLENFQDIYPLFKNCLTVIENETQLQKQIISYLQDKSPFIEKGKQGKKVLNSQRKSLNSTLKEIINVNQYHT
jgi:3-deoxy-D-manno-octulosonic-acid transferase